MFIMNATSHTYKNVSKYRKFISDNNNNTNVVFMLRFSRPVVSPKCMFEAAQAA